MNFQKTVNHIAFYFLLVGLGIGVAFTGLITSLIIIFLK
jgi:hypothetical protein